MKYFLTICCMLILISIVCAQKSNPGHDENMVRPSPPVSETELQKLKDQKLLNAKQISFSDLTYFVTYVANRKFGYNIFVNGRLYIEQNTIPAREGTVGFHTKEDAASIAVLVIKKLENGEIPPTVTIQELKEHGIE